MFFFNLAKILTNPFELAPTFQKIEKRGCNFEKYNHSFNFNYF